MELVNNVVINVYSIVLLIILGNHSLKHSESKSFQNKLYMSMLQITILILVIDIFSRFDGKPETIYSVINHFGNFMIFFISPVLPSLWLLYVHFQLFHEEQKTKRLLYPLFAINAVNAALLVLSQFYGWYYYIDSDNIYHRGQLFLFCALISVALVTCSYLLILANSKNVERKVCFSLLFFAFPPSVGILLQILFYGIALIPNSIVISFLIVFLNIQNKNVYTDYLTGVYNRKKLETYLQEKVNKSRTGKTFSAILVDFNNFKSINDSFGHDVGDDALETSAKLIRSCLRANDFIARFGGDEFCIVLNTSDRIELEEIVCRINQHIEKYNHSSQKPYIISFSTGFAVFDYNFHRNVEGFQKHIDRLMYENKRVNKEILV